MARPITTSYSDEARAEIIKYVLAQLSCGRSVSSILKDDFMPSPPTWYGWLFSDDDLSDKVERAREFGATAILDEIVDIADESGADVYIDHRNDGTPVAKIDGEAIQRSKLRVYAREKYAQMIAPRRYGPKLDLTSGGKELPANSVTNNKIEALVGVAVDRIKKKQSALAPPEDE